MASPLRPHDEVKFLDEVDDEVKQVIYSLGQVR